MPEAKHQYCAVTINKKFLNTDVDATFSIPKFHPPFVYQCTLLQTLGKSFLNYLTQKPLANFAPKNFQKKLGVYFIEQFNAILSNQNIKISDDLLKDLVYIVHNDLYRDPDYHTEEHDRSLFEKNIKQQLHAFFFNSNPLDKFYQFLSILLPVVHRKVPAFENFSFVSSSEHMPINRLSLP